MEKVKITVVGCGSIGIRHLNNLMLNENVIISAFDVTESGLQAAAELGEKITVLKSWEEIKEWQPEIVIVATPNTFHKDNTLQALSIGAHVLCEKPIATNVADAEIMRDAAAKANKVLAVGQTERFRKGIETVIQKSVSGELGNIIGGRAMVGTYNTLRCAKDPRHRAEEFGAVVVDYVHELDILSNIFGNAVKVECFGNSLGRKERGANPSLVAAVMQYEKGEIVSIHFDYVQHPQRRLLEIYGDRKVLAYDWQTDTLSEWDCDMPDCISQSFNNDRDVQFRQEHCNMIAAVRSGEKPKVSAADAVNVMKSIEKILASLQHNFD